jgi:hypothetical protein
MTATRSRQARRVKDERSIRAWIGANAWRLALLALYVLTVGIVIHSHAMWRDEIQSWLLARDSASVPALVHNLRYEGHPALWYLLLMPLTRISRDPVLMQVLHATIAVSTVAIVLWRAPLSRMEQALFPFGYFVVFEYAVKSRSYALGFLLLSVFCALWRGRRRCPVAMVLILALMANVHVLFMILSGAALVALALDRLLGKPDDGDDASASWGCAAAVAILCVGWLAAFLTAMPPADSGFATGWMLHLSRYQAVATAILAGVIFGPDHFYWQAIPAALVLAIALVRYAGNPPAAAFLAASLLGLLAFFYTKYHGYIWHHGLIFLALFAAVWIDRTTARAAVKRTPLVPSPLFGAVLAAQAFYGIAALQNDLRWPQSSGRDTARFIAAKHWQADPIVGMTDEMVSTIVGYLGVERAYYANGERWGSFVVWDKKRLEPVDMDRVLREAANFGARRTLIVAEGNEVRPALLSAYGYKEVGRFSTSSRFAWGENYTVYRSSDKAAQSKTPGH